MLSRCPTILLLAALAATASALSASVIPPPHSPPTFPRHNLIAREIPTSKNDVSLVMTTTSDLLPETVCGITDATANWNRPPNLLSGSLLLAMADDDLPVSTDSLLLHLLPVNIESPASPTSPSLPLDLLHFSPAALFTPEKPLQISMN